MHGLKIITISRIEHGFNGFNSFNGGGRCAESVTRQQAFAQGYYKTASATGTVSIELTPSEVETINTLESTIALRLANEVKNKGVE